jgi:aspartokinase-like uncharacterized kinase
VIVETVLKVGGGVLSQPGPFSNVLQAIATAGSAHRLLVVPGGGPFADAVRNIDRRHGLSASAAHWMAILAMDQYAHLLAARLDGTIVETKAEIADALASDRLPVLAPFRWLRSADPLPHDWNVTSDSIAAWVASDLGSRCLMLIKPAGENTGHVDAYFSQLSTGRLIVRIIPADQIDRLGTLLESASAG